MEASGSAELVARVRPPSCNGTALGEPRRVSNELLLFVSAPTAYDRREFLVHMFSEVCEQVIGAKVNDTSNATRIWVRLRRLLPGTAVVVGLTSIVGTLTWSSLTATADSWARHRSVLLLVLGALVTATGTACVLWSSRRAAQPKRRASEAQIAATAYLRALQFQSSVSYTRDGQLGLSGGFQFGASGEVQRPEQSRTYPELVAQFRSLLGPGRSRTPPARWSGHHRY